jgi:hypothetical protein
VSPASLAVIGGFAALPVLGAAIGRALRRVGVHYPIYTPGARPMTTTTAVEAPQPCPCGKGLLITGHQCGR